MLLVVMDDILNVANMLSDFLLLFLGQIEQSFEFITVHAQTKGRRIIIIITCGCCSMKFFLFRVRSLQVLKRLFDLAGGARELVQILLISGEQLILVRSRVGERVAQMNVGAHVVMMDGLERRG